MFSKNLEMIFFLATFLPRVNTQVVKYSISINALLINSQSLILSKVESAKLANAY